MAKVSLKNICKTYKGEKGRDVVAVTDLNLEIADREFVVFVGPSGCGKSTTLRLIAGLEEITGGEIRIGDRLVNDVPPKNRDIAMVFQNYALYPHMSVRENLAFSLRVRRHPEAEIAKRVNEASKILGIEALLDRRPKELSGGQQQRVAVGRAIVRQPKVFLFDEPLSNLDAKMRVQMRTEIIKLHQRLQATMIFVTHDQVEAMSMGQRIVIMKDGVAQQIDTPLALYHNPRNLFVASFLGSPPMNLIHGKLKAGPADTIAFTETGEGVVELTLAARPEAKAWVGREIVLGVRPEAITMADGPTKGPGTRFQAVVDLIEPMGAETNFYLQTGAHTIICRCETPGDLREAGHRLQFDVDMTKAHLFDPASTERIV